MLELKHSGKQTHETLAGLLQGLTTIYFNHNLFHSSSSSFSPPSPPLYPPPPPPLSPLSLFHFINNPHHHLYPIPTPPPPPLYQYTNKDI